MLHIKTMNNRVRFVAVSVVLTCSVFLSAQTPALKQYVYAEDGFVIAAPSDPVLEKSVQDTAKGKVESHAYSFTMTRCVIG